MITPVRLSAARRAAALAVIVLVNAVVQALLVAIAPPLPLSTGALILSAVSAVALAAAVVACWWIVAPADTKLRAMTGLVIVTGVAAAVTAILFAPVVPLVVGLGCAVIAGNGPRGALAIVRRETLRWALLTVATMLAVLLGWAAALLTGLFITGPVASALTWLIAGLLAALVIYSWVRLARRAR
ncbi:hypothetical protein [Agreia bicolorata]|uniref:Uncharacterized protein n=1 Tax=Agreia bicolorata TaxID=110935 RepID=A0ABR5CBJ7_9MICO|nr:hypothetical protein [Agreia bicolorata]KJC63005.1 hypothetical protein TZ00_17815 [Agreia bicolorata]